MCLAAAAILPDPRRVMPASASVANAPSANQCVSARPSGSQKIKADINVHAMMPRAESSASLLRRIVRCEWTPSAPGFANAYAIVPSLVKKDCDRLIATIRASAAIHRITIGATRFLL